MAVTYDVTGRSELTLRSQMRQVEKALAMPSFPIDQAAAHASKGARFEPGPPPGSVKSAFPVIPLAQPKCGHICYCPGPSTSQRFESDVIRHIDRYLQRTPLFLFRRLPSLLRALSWQEQAVLTLTIQKAKSYREVAEECPTLGLRKTQIGMVRHRALEKLARACWDESGQPILED